MSHSYHNDTSQVVRESRLFEFYASHMWPIHRIFAKKYLTPRCVRCSLSEKVSPRNPDGLCAFCASNHTDPVYTQTPEEKVQLEHELRTCLERYSGSPSREYDALILVSGGKDSALLIHKLRTEYPKLRLLTLTVDTSFMSPIALRNVDTLVTKLDVPHIRMKPDPRIFRSAYAYALTHQKGLGCAETVDTVDGELFLDVGKHVAATFGIPLLIAGFSFEQVDRYLHWDSFTHPAYDHAKREKVGVYEMSELVPEELMNVWWDPARYPKRHIPKLVCPFFVWRMNEVDIKREVALRGLLDNEEVSPLVTNNRLIPLCGLVDIFHLGYSSWEPEFSRMVREGKTDKGLWRNIFELIEYSAKTGRFISESVDVVLAELNLTRADVGITR